MHRLTALPWPPSASHEITRARSAHLAGLSAILGSDLAHIGPGPLVTLGFGRPCDACFLSPVSRFRVPCDVRHAEFRAPY